MKINFAHLVVLTLFLASCATSGRIPANDPRYNSSTECAANLGVLMGVDAFLSMRIDENAHGEELTKRQNELAQANLHKHPLVEYLKVVHLDVGDVGINSAIEKKQAPVTDMLVSAKSENKGDYILAMQQLIPKLELDAQNSCNKAGYRFSAIKSIHTGKNNYATVSQATGNNVPSSDEIKRGDTGPKEPQQQRLPSSMTVVTPSPTAAPQLELTVADRRQAEISGKIKKEFDDFKKITRYEGPEESWGNCETIFLRAWKSDTKNEATYQVYVMDYYSGEWRFYSHAFDDDGNALDFTSISRDVGSCSRYGSCSHYEHLGINVSRNYLENRKDKGIKFKISGKAGEEVCALHSPYIKAFLAAVPSASVRPILNKTPTNEAKVDSRTPEQRYEGAFLGGRLVCGATYLLSKTIEESKAKGISIDADAEKRADIGACIKKQQRDFETEYKKFLALQKSEGAKSALTDHYVAAVLAIKSISPFIGESGDSYKARQEENKRKADEKWVRYELVK